MFKSETYATGLVPDVLLTKNVIFFSLTFFPLNVCYECSLEASHRRFHCTIITYVFLWRNHRKEN